MRLLARNTFNPHSEAHYAFYTSFRDITTVLHCHDFYEFFLIADGQIIHRVNDDEQLLKQGTFVFIRPDDEHCYQGSGDSDCQLINLAFLVRSLDALLDYLGEGFYPQRLLDSPMPPVIQLSVQDTQQIIARLNTFNRIAGDDADYQRTTLRILLFELFTWLFAPATSPYRESGIEWLDTLVETMHQPEHFAEGVARMQALAGCSSEHLSRIFKAHFGITPTEFVAEVRLNYAANMLANSDRDIIYIAMEAGFGNLSHFYKLFKEKFKTTPKAYRRTQQRSLIP